jgi:Tfp pilus assembly major pilin PilA
LTHCVTPHHARAHRAFTLIDALLAMLVIGLVAVIAVPRMSSLLHKHAVRAAAMELTEHLNLARENAIAQAMPVDIDFDTNNAIYSIRRVGDSSRAGSLVEVDLREKLSSDVKLIADFDGAAILRIGIDGLPRVAEQPLRSAQLKIRDGGDTQSIVIVPGWGTARCEAMGVGSKQVTADGASK